MKFISFDLIQDFIIYKIISTPNKETCKQKQTRRRAVEFLPEHFSVLVEAADLCQQGVLDPGGVRQDGRQRGLRALVPHDIVHGLDHAPEIHNVLVTGSGKLHKFGLFFGCCTTDV